MMSRAYLKFSLLSVCLTIGMFSASADSQTPEKLWSTTKSAEFSISARPSQTNSQKHSNNYQNARLMSLDFDLMQSQLGNNSSGDFSVNAQARGLNHTNLYLINVPLPDGSLIDLSLVKDKVLPEKLAAKFPNIQTYRVLENEKVFSGKVDMNQTSFHAMLQMSNGETIFIDPVALGKNEYAVFNKSHQKTSRDRQHSCGVSSFAEPPMMSLGAKFNERYESFENRFSARPSHNVISYNIAIATTGEYSAKFGGSVEATLAAITTTVNRVNQVLERDLGIHLNLVENNDLLINTSANSDPFTDTKLLDLVYQNQDFIDAVIGNGNYDIGHLFTTNGGGLAAVGSVCNNHSKAKGVSGITSPFGDSFDLDFVAHEIGHQLGATHTFNSTQGACTEDTRTASTAFEPGSGSSIMSYAGYCGLDNIQTNADPMYHIGSIKQIAEYTQSGTGSQCGVINASNNTPPTVDAGSDFTIPAGTPFELVGSAEDSDGDSLLYAWEQLDAGDVSTEFSDKGNNALFRVHKPSSSKYRSFPPLENVLNHVPAKGESLPIHERELTMSFVTLDSKNVAQSDEMIVNVVRTGSRFALNYPRAQYTRGSTYPVYWNVANTDRAPVNCSSVNVWLSTNGGNNFDYAVAENVMNNGEALITIPADVAISTQGRFKIKCEDNIFYAVSHRNFNISDYGDATTLAYDDEDQPELNLADPSLNSTPAAISSDVNAIASSSGGGRFELLHVMLLLIFIKIIARFSYKPSNAITPKG